MRVEYREEPCKTALTRVNGMAFKWSLNPYTGCAHRCTFCYVRGFEQRADRPADARYGQSIRIKTNLVPVLRAEVQRPRWKRESVAMGTGTDPYQPAEGQYRLTRGAIEVLGAAKTPFTIVTRGPLIVRDLDVLQAAARRVDVAVHVSIPTLDQDVWHGTEPGTAPPRQRLRAVRMLVDAGIRAGVGLAPLLPGLSDRPEQLTNVVRAARDAGATHVWARVLYLPPGTREYFLRELASAWPEEAARYERLYRREYLPSADSKALVDEVARLGDRLGVADRRVHRLEPPPEPEQLALFAS
jgi:DNA repair photolyase